MKDYFVVYETDDIYNSFLVIDAKSASYAWDEACEHIGKEVGEKKGVITRFERVK